VSTVFQLERGGLVSGACHTEEDDYTTESHRPKRHGQDLRTYEHT